MYRLVRVSCGGYGTGVEDDQDSRRESKYKGSVLVCERKNSAISTVSHFAGFTCTLHTGARGVLNIAVVMSGTKKCRLNWANQ